MRVLVLSGTDAANLHTVNICRELQKRGHEIVVYSVFFNPSADYMFSKLNVQIFPYKNLTEKAVATFDVALCGDGGMAQMRKFDVYTFVYTLAIDERVTNGADFLFDYCSNRRSHYALNCASMAIGNPKNDSYLYEHDIETQKQILYIDSGHIPFGRKGKEQLADMLLKISRENPDYRVVIKPRWLRDADTTYTHKNADHIYSVLEKQSKGEIPSNLIMLNEHLDLHLLIESSECVITLYSSVIMDVLSCQKRLVIVTGYDCEDQIDFRSTDFARKREFWGQSGCVVDIADISQFMPHGIQGNCAFLNTILPDVKGASSRAADVIEFVFQNFLKKSSYPKIQTYRYETFRDEMIAAEQSWDDLKRNRIENIGRFRLATLQDKVSVPINLSSSYQFILEHKCDYELTDAGFTRFSRDCAMSEFWSLVANRVSLMNTGIDQSLLLQALYDTGNEDEILSFPPDMILCPEIYHYYLGMIYKKREVYKNPAIQEFLLFLAAANSRNYDKYPQESLWGFRNTYNYLFQHFDGENISSAVFATICTRLYEKQNHVHVDFKLRQRIHNMLPSIAEKLEGESIELAYSCLKLHAKYTGKYRVIPLKEKLQKTERELGALRKKAARIERELRQSRPYRTGEKVLWLPGKIKGGIRCVRENGWVYTLRHGKNKIRSFFQARWDRLCKKAPLRIAKVFFKQVMKGYELYRDVINEYGETARLFLSAPATGHAYVYGSFLHSYTLRTVPNCVPVFGGFGKSSTTIAKLFDIRNAVGYSMQEFRHLYNLMMFDQQQNVHVTSMHYHVFHRHTSILTYLEGLHGFNFFSLSAAYNGIESAKDITPPRFSEDTELIDQIFEENQLVRGNTVVLAPFAKTVKQIPSSFWEKLTKRLFQAGFCVCTNSIGPQEPPVKGTPPVFVPYDLSVPLLERSGISIGLRNGFHDVTSTAKCLQIVVHPKNNYRRSLVCHINDSFSLSDMYGQPNQYDFIYSSENEGRLLDDIMQLVLETQKEKSEVAV